MQNQQKDADRASHVRQTPKPLLAVLWWHGFSLRFGWVFLEGNSLWTFLRDQIKVNFGHFPLAIQVYEGT
jgi:hypothetical protein